MSDLDVLVVGAGPAGLACGTLLATNGRTVTIFDPGTLGGELLNVPEIRDFPGLEPGVTGADLAGRLLEGADAAGVTYDFLTVEALTRAAAGWSVAGDGVELVARTVVIATGSHVPIPAWLPGARDLEGRGVSVCAMCDGPLFRDRPVAVIGADDIAISEAGLLSKYAASVTLVAPPAAGPLRRSGWRGMVLDDITVETGEPIALLGDAQLSHLRVSGDREGVRDIEVAGVFLAIGREPAAGFAASAVELAADGGIPVDGRMANGAAGIYAIGDARSGSGWTAAAAIADGVTAARAILTTPLREEH